MTKLSILVYFEQKQLEIFKIFSRRMKELYDKVDINIITTNDMLELKDYNVFATIEDALNNIQQEYILYQDISVIHEANLLDLIENDFDYISINKLIKNVKISENMKKTIQENKIPDIIYFKKKIYLEENFRFTPECLKNENFKSKKIISDKIEYIFPNKIPKKIHFYWDGSKFDYLTKLTLQTFVFHNPDWEVNLWMPNLKHNNKILWEEKEFIPPHSFQYNDIDYLDLKFLKDTLGINIQNINYFDLGLKKNYHEVLKSDLFRWKILHDEGGVWSDMDILFVNNIEKVDFTHVKCKFHDIELVVSQYNKHLVNDGIDFYYIGFLMSTKGSSFFKIMFEKSIKNIKEQSYQGIGGDLMRGQFGLFDNIKNIIKHENYVNLDINSVYHYWWADLKNMYIDNRQENIFEYVQKNTGVIGYHWFRGVHLSKNYNNFLNYYPTVHNFEYFKGPLPLWVEYYKLIFNDFQLNSEQKKISIVMAYAERYKQLETTLMTISKSKYTNFEIIIVNDSQQNLKTLEQQFQQLKIVIIENTNKSYINPCMSYNKGIDSATGDIIMIQNPECCHIGDILSITSCLLKENDYLVFPTFYLHEYRQNDIIHDLLNKNNDNNFWNEKFMKDCFNVTLHEQSKALLKKTKGWSSHHKYSPTYYHFCSAIYKSDLIKIGKFSEKYKDGTCFDDDDLVRKIMLHNFNINYYLISEYPNSYPTLSQFNAFCFHQHHDKISYGNYSQEHTLKSWKINHDIFISSQFENVKIYLKRNNIFENYNIEIENGCIEKVEDKCFSIKFNSHTNKMSIIPVFELENFTYFFNGKSASLSNNLVELYNMCDFLITIISNSDTLTVNNKILEKNNKGEFIFEGKLLDSKIIVENNTENTVIQFDFRIKSIENVTDNTILKKYD